MTTLDVALEIGRNTGGSYPVIACAGGQIATSRLAGLPRCAVVAGAPPEVLVPRQPLRAAAPLRILGMVVRPGDQQEIDEERQRLGAALAGWEREGLVELGWVAGPTSGDLKRALYAGPWHAFHFVGHEAGPILHTRKEVNAVAFSPDGRWLATAGADRTVRLWALGAREVERRRSSG